MCHSLDVIVYFPQWLYIIFLDLEILFFSFTVYDFHKEIHENPLILS